MPGGRRPLREGSSGGGGAGAALWRALGVTRVASLTGLDRTGVEVASAVRPRGHVLQVTNGKGLGAAEAVRGALLEAAELHAAERAEVDAFGSAAELAARHGGRAVLGPAALDPDAGPGVDGVRTAWRAGRDLGTGERVLVPAHAVHVPPPGGPWLGPALLRWTSNGLGASRDPSFALLHALLEAVERDRLARALPEGFTEEALAERLLDARGLPPRTAALAERIERGGLRVFLMDVSEPGLPGRGRGRGPGPRPRPGPRPGETPLGLPVAAALILDVEGGAVPLAAGYACRLTPDGALHAALLEAAQSRATEIHGAREDVAGADRRAAGALRTALEAARPARDAAALPRLRAGSTAAAARAVSRRLGAAGFRPVVVDLAGPPGVAVAKVLAPGLLLSELL